MANEPVELIIKTDGLDDLIEQLHADGRIVIGPTVRDGVIVHDTIATASDLPTGWTEQQGPGSYRLVETGDDRKFAFSSPSQSWKQYVHPPRAVTIRARRTPDGISIDEPGREAPRVAFFGIRSCDLAAIDVLDRVMLDPDHIDPTYRNHRADVFVIAVACSDPGDTCFCASMNTGPSPTSDFDLALTELTTPTGIEYLVRSGSPRGATLVAVLGGRAVSEADQSAATSQHDDAVQSMGRSLDPADPPLAATDLEHPRWAEVAERCLACGNCTMVCPTCFCTSVEETTSFDGTESERSRVWDSCFTLDFTHLHGGSTRTSTESRYRQWLLHKLVTWHEQFDMSGCVGCGRCITWCPVGIDLTVEVAALAQKQKVRL